MYMQFLYNWLLAKCRGMVPQTVFEHVGLVYGDTFMEGS